MPLAITRFFDDQVELKAAARKLVHVKRLPHHIVSTYDNANGLVELLTSKGVEPGTAEAYRDRMDQGGAVLLVLADYTPLGVARITRETLANYRTADVGIVPEEAEIKFVPGSNLSVLRGGPLMMTRRHNSDDANYHMANWPIPLLTQKQPGPEPLIPRHGRMASWPIGLLLPGNIRFGRFPIGLLVPGNKFMAKFPFGHIVPGHKFMAKFPFGHIVPGHKFMAKFPFGHIVPGHKFMAKFPFGHLVPGHRRMANWPFPLLINGDKHRKPRLPPQRFWAKFPFAHIVPGHKFMAKFPFAHIVPGHKFMAKFPFGHIIPGHRHMAKFPFGHIVPGHKYMANWIWPHTKTKDN